MNRKEKETLCTLLADWEFISGGSTSEAAARYSCSDDIRKTLGISDEDMAFDRAWKIAGIIGDQSDDFIDLLVDAVLEDYEAVIDAFEKGPAELRAILATAPAKQGGGG